MKITTQEVDLVEARAKIFGWNYQLHTKTKKLLTVKIRSPRLINIKFVYDSYHKLYRVLVLGGDLGDDTVILINNIINQKMEDMIMSDEFKNKTGAELYEQLKQTVQEMGEDINKRFVKENSSAGLRVRKSLKVVNELSKALKAKSLEK